MQGIPGSNPGWALFFPRSQLSKLTQNNNESDRVRNDRCVLANYTIFFEAKVIHGIVNGLFDLLPVGPSLDEFIHVLEGISIRKFECNCVNYLGPVGPTITRGVSHDLRKILSVIHNEYVAKHLEMGEIRRDALHLVILISCRFSGAGDHLVRTFNPAMNEW